MRRIRRGILGEDRAAGVGDAFVSSRSDLSKQGLELGEDLLDWIEVWGVFRQEHEAGPDVPDRSSHGFSFVGAEVVEDHDVARLEGRNEDLLDIGVKALAIDRPSNRQGASMRSLRRAARKVAVFQRPCGTASTRRSPFGAQPRSLVMLVFVQVSSMKMRRLGSMSP